MDNPILVICLGILSTMQLHLAKALQRQGIDALNQFQASLRGNDLTIPQGRRRPLIYLVGVALNQTVFLYAILAQPYGPPALYTSMFGMGLVFLMVYAAGVLKEKISWREMIGALSILVGTLVIGIENIGRHDDRFTMRLEWTLVFIFLLWVTGWLSLRAALRKELPDLTGLVFGILAGGLGALDPFLKGVGQSLGGNPHIVPVTLLGQGLFLASFPIGFLAFLVTQWGFLHKARASVLVSAYNASYILLPVLLQAVLLPGYQFYWMTLLGMVLILGGVVRMRGERMQDSKPLIVR